MAMTENEYMAATNLARLRGAILLIQDVHPINEVENALRAEVLRKLDVLVEKCSARIEIKED